MKVRIRVPATSANLGPGFDVLGLAVSLYLEVTAEAADDWSIRLEGYGADVFPANEDHLVVRACKQGLARWGDASRCFALTIHNGIPISGGLGGSAAAVVAGLAMAQHAAGSPLDRDALFALAAEIEGHPDNVAPAVYGGLRLCGRDAHGFRSQPGSLHPKLGLVLITPPAQADTEAMRAVLPNPPPEADLIFTRELLQQVIGGMASGNRSDLAGCARDKRHQPYRFAVQPRSRQAFEVLQKHPHVLGAFLSGSGATVAGWIDQKTDPQADLTRELTRLEMPAPVYTVTVDHDGIRVLEPA